MGKTALAAAVIMLDAPLMAQTSPQVTKDLPVNMSPQQYRICNDRPARPTGMEEVHSREAHKALALMDLHELLAWEKTVETGDPGCDVRFPSWDTSSAEYVERFSTITQADHTQARLAFRDEQNQIARKIPDLCEAQGSR